MSAPQISVILPVLNEAQHISQTLQNLLRDHRPHEVVIVDGGSRDDTREQVRRVMQTAPSDVHWQCLDSAPGRARQMNHGAHASHGNVLLFLHADTRLPAEALENINRHMLAGSLWGHFAVSLDSGRIIFRIIEWFMNRRSALTAIATGDQAIFVRRDLFELMQGFADIPLMEDIELSRRMKSVQRPTLERSKVITSTRRWQQRGVIRTVLLMWWLRFCYWLGVSPQRLARWYR